MRWQAGQADIQEATDGIVAYMLKNTKDMDGQQAVVFVYNNAMRDAIDALSVYAEKNPQHRLSLNAVADELARNFMLAEPGSKDDG